MQAQGVVFTGPNRVSYQSIKCPDPGPSDVLVRITHSWISNGTEGSYLRGERSDGDTPYLPGDPLPFPVVAGYQKVGVVEHRGEKIDDLEVGETVFATIGLVEGMHHTYGDMFLLLSVRANRSGSSRPVPTRLPMPVWSLPRWGTMAASGPGWKRATWPWCSGTGWSASGPPRHSHGVEQR